MKVNRRVVDIILSGASFSYSELCIANDDYRDEGRVIDRLLQKLRRRGFIFHWRDGRKVTWQVYSTHQHIIEDELARIVGVA